MRHVALSVTVESVFLVVELIHCHIYYMRWHKNNMIGLLKALCCNPWFDSNTKKQALQSSVLWYTLLPLCYWTGLLAALNAFAMCFSVFLFGRLDTIPQGLNSVIFIKSWWKHFLKNKKGKPQSKPDFVYQVIITFYMCKDFLIQDLKNQILNCDVELSYRG